MGRNHSCLDISQQPRNTLHLGGKSQPLAMLKVQGIQVQYQCFAAGLFFWNCAVFQTVVRMRQLMKQMETRIKEVKDIPKGLEVWYYIQKVYR